ncbi:hypothetical protein D910_02019 [Dendroctonus ponderosae]|uniref:DH domain-containing protein n=1 Tax=Dendroctonus ponderosae TaxID=77166 RepID=U4U1V8_DENPD|nr:hypothetical protein D910_02019 [Dendroctonus ponderosae]
MRQTAGQRNLLEKQEVALGGCIGYLEPWRNDPDCPLGQHLQDLFTNLEEIHEFNRQILEDLRKANLDPTKTANVFLQHDGGFKVYNDFCARYPRTMEVLSALQRDDEISPLIREKQLQLGHALPLGSYLLKPVQRILKYHLLLQVSSKSKLDSLPKLDGIETFKEVLLHLGEC